MPTLDWIGKKAVVGHHNEVSFRLLTTNEELSCGDLGTGNLVVQADNLLALKALLPFYAGQVKCIYIDPPYNTGNENWVYNDNVNSPEIREWLGRVVGGEAEDLSRHDKWLCMMYPRLSLLRQFLREDGAIFISIDDNEVQNLRAVMDEIFGQKNFVTTIVWQKIYTVKSTARHFSEMHDYIVLYAKNLDLWQRNLLERTEKQDRAYTNPDGDPRGPWKATPMHARNFYSQGLYPIICPSGRVIPGPPTGRYWVVSEDKFRTMDADNQIWWGESGNNMPAQKRFLQNVRSGVVPATLWFQEEAGHNAEAKNELRDILSDAEEMFITPKPVRLLKRILQVATSPSDLILDSFAGSGTTGHAILAMNAQNGGTRRFILVEMDKKICQSITAERLRRVANGYTAKRSGGKVEEVPGIGGGFRYTELGAPLFDADGHISRDVSFGDLARFVFFTETGEPLPTSREKPTPLIGTANDVAVYLLYNGILSDKSAEGGNVLTRSILADLPDHRGPKVIYGMACHIDNNRLKREGITFRQIPYQIKVT